jgi:hypothetical protein
MMFTSTGGERLMQNHPFPIRGLGRLLLTSILSFVFVVGLQHPAQADVEDVLLEKGMLTKEDWVKIKAEKEKLKAESEVKTPEYRVPELSRSESLAALKGIELGAVVYLNATFASGTSFTADTTKGISNSTANNNKGLASGFHFSRTYLTLKKYMDNGDHFRLTLDQMLNDVGGNSCNQTAGAPAGNCHEAAPFGLSGFGGTGRNNTFIKYVYYERVFVPGLQLRIGMHQTPWVEYEEGRWTYRYLFPIMVDQQNFQTSSDLGISLMGKVWNGKLEYHISFAEGEGYQNTPDGRGYAVLGRVSLEPIKGVIISTFGHNERQRNGIEGFNPSRLLGNVELYDPSHDRFKINGQMVWADDGHDLGKTGFK